MRNLLTLANILIACVFISACTSSGRNKNKVLTYRDSIPGIEKSVNSTEKKSDALIPSVPLNPIEYVKWVRQNDVQEQQRGEITYSLQHKPHDYIVCMEVGSEQINKDQRKTIMNDLGYLEYFDLRIGLVNGTEEFLKYHLSDKEEYNRRVKYYAFDFKNDISLISNSDTLHPVLFHFERAYDLIPYATFSLAFSKDKINYSKNISLEITDDGVSHDTIQFYFKGEDLIKAPKLKTL